MKLYNTLTRNLDDVNPLRDKHISLYTCGLTVYSQPHIGNWVAYIYWDILVRTLKASGYNVTRVQNITDVGHLTSDEDAGEDKMLKGALKEGLTAWEVAEKYIAIADDEAYTQLGLIRPDHMPRATEYIPQQIAFVEELERKGFTYKLDDGVYFDTSKLKDYGQLARLDIEGLRFGARVADSGKKNPTDFAVWKFSDPSEKRDMEWDSPWGVGFPGWHLECSVMARELLGDQIDIHTGGIDHISVHHTNEIAQTEAITKKPFATMWVHANHIKVNGTKISKSIGNGFTLKDITDKDYDLAAFKLMVLSKHYRTEGNFTWEILDAAQNRLKNWGATVDLLWQSPESALMQHDDQSTKHGIMRADVFEDQLLKQLQNDLNTPEALALVDKTLDVTAANELCTACLDSIVSTIYEMLGIDLRTGKSDISDEQKAILTKRQTARDEKDWATADTLRDELADQGILVRDTPHGQIWSRA